MSSSSDDTEGSSTQDNVEKEEEKESLQVANNNEYTMNGSENALETNSESECSNHDGGFDSEVDLKEDDSHKSIPSNEIKNEKSKDVQFILKEYEHVKDELLKLQEEYKSSLQREKSLCERLQNVHTEDDLKVSRLSQVNEELREQLANLIDEASSRKDELKSTKAELDSTQRDRDKLSTELAKLHIERVEERDSLRDRVKALEEQENSQLDEVEVYKTKLEKHDMFAKRAIASLEKEMALRVDQVTKMYEESLKDKETLGTKFSQVNEEKKKLFIEKELLIGKFTDNSKETEKLKVKLKAIQVEFAKTQQELEEKEREFTSVNKEFIKIKDEMNSHVVKVKWAQNKLKNELEAHKETKNKLIQVTQKLKESKEEGEMIRANCQALIKKYQESEDMKSSSLDHQLKQKEDELRKHEQEIADQDEVHKMRLKELESLKECQKNHVQDLKESRAQVTKFEEKMTLYALKVAEHEKKAMSITKENHHMKQELEDALEYKEKYTKEMEKVVMLTDEVAKHQACIADLEADITGGHSNQSQLLEFTEKLTAKNALLQSEATSIQAKYDSIMADKRNLEEQLGELRSLKAKMENKYKEETAKRSTEIEELAKCVQEKTKTVEHLTLTLEEAKDELQVAKRKNVATIKDLTRQLQQSRRQVEKLESNQLGSKESLTNGNGDSKSSSTNSLDKISSLSTSPTAITSMTNPAMTHSVTDSGSGMHRQDSVQIVQPVQSALRTGKDLEPDKKLLVDRICRLQKIHAKKNEKLEFMEEHINTLVDEIQKKGRIIQYYALREEAGMLAPPRSDVNKAQLSRHGGIMASLYASKPIDHNMTLELSLEINKKLQAVLEDTILKNMTLKENLDTLGDEITRLNDELVTCRKGRR